MKSVNLHSLRLALLAGCSLALTTPALAADVGASGSAMVADGVAADGVADGADEAATVGELIVTARRRAESAQSVPVALTAVSVETLEATGTYNVGQLTQLAPSLQFISSNPRNTSFNIRGLGNSFGLANSGLDTGVGLYIDQVYYARPAAATFDFVDLAQVEVLRGPQGTLFGKNTTAGALNITTKSPTFEPQSSYEVSVGDIGFFQAKGSISGPLVEGKLAGRLSVGGTQRNGTLYNVTTGEDINAQSSVGLRAQLLWTPDEALTVRLSADYAEQSPECCTQVYVAYGPTLKPAAQQFPALATAFGYAPPSLNPYDRKADVDSPTNAGNRFGGVAAIADWDLGFGTLTSVSSWRFWDWKPQNDRDYTSLPILLQSANVEQQSQWSQELRLASNGSNRVDYVAGLYAFRQDLDAQPVSEWGPAAALWLIGPSVPANLLDGYTSKAVVKSGTSSYAAFGQATWNITETLSLTGGARYTSEDKDADYRQVVFGGLATADPVLIARKNGIARAQAYKADVSDSSVSGQATLSWKVTRDIMVYGSYARGYKSGGLNLAGLPTKADGSPALTSAVVKPEEVTTAELGVKSQFFDRRVTLNIAAFQTVTNDYQANVVDTGPGALRGYLANIEEVEVKGVEVDLSAAPIDALKLNLSVAYSDGEYVSFANGPCPLEKIGTTTTVCDLSGKSLPGLSDWVVTYGGEYHQPVTFGTVSGEAYVGLDASYRSDFYSDASVSKYALIEGYTVVNGRIGLRSDGPWELSIWAKNLLDEEYLLFTSVQAGNSGLILGNPGDPRTYGLTLKAKY